MANQIEFHEAADIFHLDDEHLDELTEGIKANGLLKPIELFDGKILDGRRRWTACQRLGITPTFITVNPKDPVDYAVELNKNRRHLTKSQGSMCAARADGLKVKLAEEAAGRKVEAGKVARAKQTGVVPNCAPPQNTGKTRDKLAEQFGVSHGSVDRARKVIATGNEELISAVDKGKVTVAKAAAIAANPPELHARLLEVAKGGRASPKSQPSKNSEATEPTQEERAKSKAIFLANEAIDALKKIPKNDPLRKRGFQIVSDWIKAHK